MVVSFWMRACSQTKEYRHNIKDKVSTEQKSFIGFCIINYHMRKSGYVIGYNKSTEYIVKLYTNNTSIMTYNIAKLAEFNPALAAELKNRCYTTLLQFMTSVNVIIWIRRQGICICSNVSNNFFMFFGSRKTGCTSTIKSNQFALYCILFSLFLLTFVAEP